MALQLPEAFERSYCDFESYPKNLVYQTSYRGALEAYAVRLDNAEPDLFTSNEQEVDFPVRDSSPTGIGRFSHASIVSQLLIHEGFDANRNIHDDEALKRWLGDQSAVDPVTLKPAGNLATKADPKCRFM
jgi:hypothetical protein